MRFSLLHPSRERPHKSKRIMEKWINAATGYDFEVIVSIDESEPYKDQYKQFYSAGRFNNPNIKVIINHNTSAVQAINKAAEVSTGDILIVVSDDTDAISGWDKILNQVIGSHVDFLLKVYDGIQDWIVTMPIMDRTYYNRFGYIYYPEFRHMFCDTYLTHVADALGRMIIRNDVVIPHLHYSVNKSEKDDVSRQADNTFNEGKEIYIKLLRQNLLLDKSVNIWNLSRQAKSHLTWINNVMRR